MNRKALYKKMEAKFLKGQKEHRDNIKDMSDKQNLQELQDELIDGIFFINRLLNKIKT